MGEIVIMMRKILMVAIAVFFNYDIQIQSLLATLLVVTALCVHALACPYVTDAMDGLELLSLFGSFCTYFFGQFLFTPSVSDAGRAIVSFIIVFVNMAVLISIFAMVMGHGCNAVSKFGAKLRNVCCCRKNSQPNSKGSQNTNGTLAIQQPQPLNVGHMQRQIGSNDPAAEFTYDTNSRGKRKKKSRNEDAYGNVNYANVDNSQSMEPPSLPRADSVPSFLEEEPMQKQLSPTHLPPLPNKNIKLQSNLLGNNTFTSIDEQDVAMGNQISVDKAQYGDAYANEFAYHGSGDFDESQEIL